MAEPGAEISSPYLHAGVITAISWGQLLLPVLVQRAGLDGLPPPYAATGHPVPTPALGMARPMAQEDMPGASREQGG